MESYVIPSLSGVVGTDRHHHPSPNRLLIAETAGSPALVLAPGHALVRVHKTALAESAYEHVASALARAHCQNQAVVGSPPQRRVYPLDSSHSWLVAGLVVCMEAAASASEVELAADDMGACYYCRVLPAPHPPPPRHPPHRHSRRHDPPPYPRTRPHSFQNSQTGSKVAKVAWSTS